MFLELELKDSGKKGQKHVGSIKELRTADEPFKLYTYYDSIKQKYLDLKDTVYASMVGANKQATINPTDTITNHLYHMGSEYKFRVSHFMAVYGENENCGIPFQFYYSPNRYRKPLWRMWPTAPIVPSLVQALSKMEEQYSAHTDIRHIPWLREYLERETANIVSLEEMLRKFPIVRKKQPA